MDEKATGIDLLRKLRLAPDAHILVRRDVPIAADDALANGDRVRVIAVVSGGSGE
jgi:sulfur carrier protein ThiS